MDKPRFTTLAGMIFLAAASRLIPHPPNFTPLAAMALFGGASISDRRLAFGLPLAALLLSDAVLGFYHGMIWVYGSFALIVCLGWQLQSRRRLLPVAGTALASSVLFFALTNFGVWASDGMYPRTLAGLGACYVAAIPFFQNTIAGDLFYAALLFGGFALAEKKFPALRASSATQAA
ncbi:MAG TPA: DUF6580 family putative transport protein [Opitutaceae bacterium]|nr:DUF6580 family putative transport protein [Opitutaceae bacterium]